jgi:hypothetical protein
MVVSSLTVRHQEKPSPFFSPGVKDEYDRIEHNTAQGKFRISGTHALTSTLRDNIRSYFFPLRLEAGVEYVFDNLEWGDWNEEPGKVIIRRNGTSLAIPRPLPDIFSIYDPEFVELAPAAHFYFRVVRPRFPTQDHHIRRVEQAVMPIKYIPGWELHSNIDSSAYARKLVEDFIYTSGQQIEDVCKKIESDMKADMKKSCQHCKSAKKHEVVTNAQHNFYSRFVLETVQLPLRHKDIKFTESPIFD